MKIDYISMIVDRSELLTVFQKNLDVLINGYINGFSIEYKNIVLSMFDNGLVMFYCFKNVREKGSIATSTKLLESYSIEDTYKEIFDYIKNSSNLKAQTGCEEFLTPTLIEEFMEFKEIILFDKDWWDERINNDIYVSSNLVS